MRIMCSQEIFTKKCWQQQIFDSDLKGAWHYNHVTFTPIAKNFMLYCRLIYMLSILCVILTIKVKVGIPESFKVRWYPLKKTGSSHLKYSSVLTTANLLSIEPALCLTDNKHKDKAAFLLLICSLTSTYYTIFKLKHNLIFN